MTLRFLANEDVGTSPVRRINLVKKSEPIPLLYDLSQHRDDDGPYVDATVVWNVEDALRCRHCPQGECTLRDGREGIACCTVRRRGTLADVSALRLPGA